MINGSTAGARYLAESGNWLAWQAEGRAPANFGTLIECAFLHWSIQQAAAFLAWRRTLPGGSR